MSRNSSQTRGEARPERKTPRVCIACCIIAGKISDSLPPSKGGTVRSIFDVPYLPRLRERTKETAGDSRARVSTDPIKKLLRYWRPNVSSVPGTFCRCLQAPQYPPCVPFPRDRWLFLFPSVSFLTPSFFFPLIFLFSRSPRKNSTRQLVFARRIVSPDIAHRYPV